MDRELVTVNVFGHDRKGVVAGITSFVFQQGGNIEELVEQVTRQAFHMTLVASWPRDGHRREAIARGLLELGKRLRMEIGVRFQSVHGRPRMAVFVTKETHCLEALMRAIRARRVKAEPVLLVSNHREMAGEARRWRLPFLFQPWTSAEPSESRVLRELERHEVDFLVLARFMKILSPKFTWRWRNRVINIHPSLLPAFRGASAYRQAWEFGAKVVGVTAHFATPDLDGGPIICQDALRVRPGEALSSIVARGRRLEARTLLRAVKLHLANKLDVYWGRVKVVA